MFVTPQESQLLTLVDGVVVSSAKRLSDSYVLQCCSDKNCKTGLDHFSNEGKIGYFWCYQPGWDLASKVKVR
jgi:hypothetical protein